MTLRAFLLIAAAVHGLMGLGLLVAPLSLLEPLGLAASAGVAVLGRVLGASLLALAAVLGWLRTLRESPLLRTALFGRGAYAAATALVLLIGAASGATSHLGWLPAGILIALATGFLYFAPVAGEPPAPQESLAEFMAREAPSTSRASSPEAPSRPRPPRGTRAGGPRGGRRREAKSGSEPE